MDFRPIINGIEKGLVLNKLEEVTEKEFKARLDYFKHFNFINLSNDDIFWILTYVMFFNMGRKASMIENKLSNLKEYLFKYKYLANATDLEINQII